MASLFIAIAVVNQSKSLYVCTVQREHNTKCQLQLTLIVGSVTFLQSQNYLFIAFLCNRPHCSDDSVFVL